MTHSSIHIHDLMASSGVSFGTSGARGLVRDMTDRVCYSYTVAFLQHLTESVGLSRGSAVAVAGDFRPSSPRIMAAVAAAITDCGFEAVNCGHIATPAVANYGISKHIPSIMVTGSHIPDDRNGIKFNTADGEILKEDEAAIRQQVVRLKDEEFDSEGAFCVTRELPAVDNSAAAQFVSRYLDFFLPSCLQGMKIGLYEHSTVVRQALFDILTGLGAVVDRLGYSDKFIPVDTEAVRDEDIELAQQWCREHSYDAIVSADGDGDRPLISDEAGEWLRGDVVGVLAAQYLGASVAVTPVSSNTVVEKVGLFDEVVRTRIGSPYVIAGMQQARERHGGKVVIGYEANGGFLTETVIEHREKSLAALPTRDCVLPILSILAMKSESSLSISDRLQTLPHRYTYSDRLKDFPTEVSKENLSQFTLDNTAASLHNMSKFLGSEFAKPIEIDTTDGVRVLLEDGDIIHFRPSGNAPELRCYTEAKSKNEAISLNVRAIDKLKSWRT